MSQRLIRPLNGCRIATLIHLTDVASLGEAVTRPSGTNLGKQAYRNLLREMRNATNEPLRHGYNQGHIPAMMAAGFPDYPEVELYNETWANIVGSVKDGYAVSLAGRAGDGPGERKGVPASSPLRQYTDVDHQILVVRQKVKDGVTKWLVYDPMAPWDPSHKGYWVRRDHVRTFAGRFKEGKTYVAERVKIGSWTKAARVRREEHAELEACKKAKRKAVAARKRALAELETVKAELERATNDLETLRAPK